MAKKPDPAAIDALVTNALVTLATADGKRRLVAAKGAESPALFPSNSGANKAAIERCKDEARPLVLIVGKGKTESVELTAAGFEMVLPHLPEEKVGAAARPLAELLPLAERVTFLNEIVRRTPLAAAELLPVIEVAAAAEKAELAARAEAAAKRRKQEEEALAAMERWKALVGERRQQRIETLKRELEAEGEQSTDIPQSPPHPVPRFPVARLTPETAEDRDFRRQIARRLVSSWLDTWQMNKPDARQFLETAIWNLSGFRQIGEPGQHLSFDGELHEGPPGLFPGDAVRVVRPGWVLEEDDREYVVSKAMVRS